MMKKRLSKTLWYGTDVDSYGNPVIPPFTADPHDLEGLHVGELFLHIADKATLWTANESGNVVNISGGNGNIDLSQYLLTADFNELWEIRYDSSGTAYIFGKLPLVTQYGITMYSGENVNVPGIYDGLPIDNTTIYWDVDSNGNKVLKAVVGSSGGGVADSVAWANVYGKPLWLNDDKPVYSYSEIKNTPDLSVYALKSDIPSLSGYATEQWVLGKGYALSSDLSKYIPISGATDITGEKNFTGGLKVNGSPIYYDTEKKYWKLEGDLLVTGGVTMYGNDSDFVASTIMDAILYDDSTLGINANGELYVKGSVGGATTLGSLTNVGSWADSVASQDRIMYQAANSSQWVAKNLSDLAVGGITGDYLPLTGGTLSGALTVSNGNQWTPIKINRAEWGESTFVVDSSGLYISHTIDSVQAYLQLHPNNGFKFNGNTILHAANYSSYALPLSGGTLTNTLTIDNSDVGLILHRIGQRTPYIRFGQDTNNEWGELGVYNDGRLVFWPLVSSQGGYGQWNTIWHAGNDGSGSGLDADMLDGVDESGFCRQTNGISIESYRNVGYGFKGDGWSTDGAALSVGISNSLYLMQLQADAYNTQLLFRKRANGTFSEWKTIAFTDSNVASATKLQTARTIWGQSFDGTGNVSGTLSGVHDIDFASKGNYVVGTFDKNANTIYTNNIHSGKGNNLWLKSTADTYITNSDGTTKFLTILSSGNILVTGGITMYSARKLKTIQDERGLSLEELSTIKPTRFTWKDGRDNRIHIGGIADDVMKVLPEVIYKTGEDDTLTMDYGNAAFAIAASLIKPVVNHEERIRLLEDENKRLKEEIEQLKWNIA